MAKRCTTPFSVWTAGVPRVYTAGQLVNDQDDILTTHSHLFEDVEAAAKSRPAARSETATAAPDEVRALTSPPDAETAGDASPAPRRPRRTK